MGASALSAGVHFAGKGMKSKARRNRGQGLVEYALILALAVVIVVTALTVFGGRTTEMLGNVNNTWTNAT